MPDKLFDTSIFRAPQMYAQYVGVEYRKRKRGVSIGEEDDKNCDYIFSKPPQQSNYRTVFSCDRDRILYSEAFQRLALKTQVFRAGDDDRLRTRFTHTLEVSQIARTISTALGLDNDLVEAIALGHDVGHTPFGHAGERVLHKFSMEMLENTKPPKQVEAVASTWGNTNGFKHNQQSVRVLADFSNGIRLTNFCMYGIRNHSKLCWGKQGAKNDPDSKSVEFYSFYDEHCAYEDSTGQRHQAWSVEAYIVYWADEIAQRHHDIEDAYKCNLLSRKEICECVDQCITFCRDSNHPIEDMCRVAEKLAILKTKNDESFVKFLSSLVVDTYVTCFIEEIRECLKKMSEGIESREDFIEKYLSFDENDVRKRLTECDKGKPIGYFDKLFRDKLIRMIVPSFEVQRQDGKGEFIIRKLVSAYITNPQQLPDQAVERVFKKELPRYFKKGDYDQFFRAKKIDDTHLPRNTNLWSIIDCRSVLQKGWEESVTYNLLYPLVFRSIFDYVASMTDSFALSEYSKLYG